MAITVQQLKQYMEANKNILIAGEAGTGKTEMLRTAANELGLSMKYYSSSTLDPFADLVGIPVPDTISKLVEYYRPREIDEAQVIFFDELNRADPKTINAVMEIIQFRSINGDPLKNLKCVVAAINPVDVGYNTEELDIAVRDRFDFFLTSEVVADYPFFKAKYGPTVARTAIDLFKEYQVSYKDDKRSKKNTLGYFSPRRLEKVLDAFMQFQTAEIIAASLPDDIIIAHKHWAMRIEEAVVGVKKININPDEAVAGAKELIKLGPSDLRRKSNQEPLIKTYGNLKILVAQQKTTATIDALGNQLDAQGVPVVSASMEEKLMYKLRTSAAAALNAGVNTGRIAKEYGPIVRDFDANQQRVLTQNWQYTKTNNYNESLRAYLANNPEPVESKFEVEVDKEESEQKGDPSSLNTTNLFNTPQVMSIVNAITITPNTP
jgi:dynein-related subfamily AAA family protein